MTYPHKLCSIFILTVALCLFGHPLGAQSREDIERLRREADFLLSEVRRAQEQIRTLSKATPGVLRDWLGLDEAYRQVGGGKQRAEAFVAELEQIFAVVIETPLDLRNEIARERRLLEEINRRQERAVVEWSFSRQRRTGAITPTRVGPDMVGAPEVAPERLVLYQFAFGTFAYKAPGILEEGQQAQTIISFVPAYHMEKLSDVTVEIIPRSVLPVETLRFEPNLVSRKGVTSRFRIDEPIEIDLKDSVEWSWTTTAMKNFRGATLFVPFQIVYKPSPTSEGISTWIPLGIEIKGRARSVIFTLQKFLGDMVAGVVGLLVGLLGGWLWRLTRRRSRTSHTSLSPGPPSSVAGGGGGN